MVERVFQSLPSRTDENEEPESLPDALELFKSPGLDTTMGRDGGALDSGQ